MATKTPAKPTVKTLKKAPARPGEARPRAVSARQRTVSIVEELRAIEGQLAEMASRATERLEQGAQDGSVAAGGFSSLDSMLLRVARPGSFLGSLGASSHPVSQPPRPYREYAALLDELDVHEQAAMELVARAKTRLSSLEDGDFRAVGYASYEEMLDRALRGMPRLATTLLATDERFSSPPGAAEVSGSSPANASVEAIQLRVSAPPRAPSPPAAPAAEAARPAASSLRSRAWRAALAALGVVTLAGSALAGRTLAGHLAAGAGGQALHVSR